MYFKSAEKLMNLGIKIISAERQKFAGILILQQNFIFFNSPNNKTKKNKKRIGNGIQKTS